MIQGINKMKNLNKLKKKLQERKIGRREFMARIAALGLTAAVSPTLLTAVLSQQLQTAQPDLKETHLT